MKDSTVRIYKYDKNGYSYSAYIYCEGDTVSDEIVGVEPVISISFVEDNISNETIQDVSSSGFKITIEGGKKMEKLLV